jgi:hypothetical protein
VLGAIVTLALLALVLATTALSRPDSAVAAPMRPAAGTAAHTPMAKPRGTKRATRTISPGLRWGGASPRSGFDCSGLVQYVYGRLGIRLPHYAASQYSHGHRVARGALRAGDLVFFSGLGHVGIYAGGGKFIHAPRRGTTVRWSRLSTQGSYYGATRLVTA